MSCPTTATRREYQPTVGHMRELFEQYAEAYGEDMPFAIVCGANGGEFATSYPADIEEAWFDFDEALGITFDPDLGGRGMAPKDTSEYRRYRGSCNGAVVDIVFGPDALESAGPQNPEVYRLCRYACGEADETVEYELVPGPVPYLSMCGRDQVGLCDAGSGEYITIWKSSYMKLSCDMAGRPAQ